MDISSLLGPAVVAAVISGLVSCIGMYFSAQTARALHSEKLAFDREQSERKVSADIALAEKKLALDRALADWKRRTELAERVLADFYKARDLFRSARSPFVLGHEGSSRSRDEVESESESSYRNAMYAPFERLSKNIDFFSGLHARRYACMALFGPDSGRPFELILEAYNKVGFATTQLLDSHRAPQSLSNVRHEEFEITRRYLEATIGLGTREEDPIDPLINEAVAKIESICRPVLETKPV